MPLPVSLRATALAAGVLLLAPVSPAHATAVPSHATDELPWPRLPFLGKRKAPADQGATRPTAKPTAPAAPTAPRTAADTVRAAEAAAEREARQGFADSWFWGAKAGAIRFGTISEGMITAPSVGADWLITRQRAALLVGFDQVFFNRTSAIVNPMAADSLLRVNMKNARRFSVTALAFPKRFGQLRPYAGAGLAIELVDGAEPRASSAGPGRRDPNQGVVDDAASRMAFQLMGGAQYQLGRAAAFVQGSISPAQNNGSLWNYGKPGMVEAGIRFNFGDAVERF